MWGKADSRFDHKYVEVDKLIWLFLPQPYTVCSYNGKTRVGPIVARVDNRKGGQEIKGFVSLLAGQRTGCIFHHIFTCLSPYTQDNGDSTASRPLSRPLLPPRSAIRPPSIANSAKHSTFAMLSHPKHQHHHQQDNANRL